MGNMKRANKYKRFKCDNQIICNLQDIEQSNRLNTDDFLCQYLLFRFALSPTRKNIFDEISNVLESFFWTNKLVNIYWKFDKYLVPAVTAESQKQDTLQSCWIYPVAMSCIYSSGLISANIKFKLSKLNMINWSFYPQIINVDSTKRLLQIWRQLGQWRHSQHPEIQLYVHSGASEQFL